MVAGGSGLKYSLDGVVIKSANDLRLYRVIQLSNGLVALLVQDPLIYPDGLPQASHLLDKTELDAGAEDEDEGENEDEDGDEANDEKQIEEKTAQTKKAAAAMCVRFGS